MSVTKTPESEARFISDAVRWAAGARRKLRIRGSGSKDFYGDPTQGDVLQVDGYRGIVDYDPADLVLTARAGTPLSEIETLLAAHDQMLAFEPPQFGGGGTLGGCIAAGLSGPRRPYAGAVRDFVLGARMVGGRGECLNFGGRVIKNVAGYDVARLMTGALGTLGVLLDISLKVSPRKPEATLQLELNEASAIEHMNRWAARGLPLSGSCYDRRMLSVRFTGAPATINRVRAQVGGEPQLEGAKFWRSIRDQTAQFFATAPLLWRVSVPATTAPLSVGDEQLIEWGGALRWLAGDFDAATLRAKIEARGGHAMLFRAPRSERVSVFHPLRAESARLHRELKRIFDPHGILNCGRLGEV